MCMVIRHNCDVINHVKMRVSFRKHEKEKKMQCKISHSGWLGKVSINHPQGLCCYSAVFACTVRGKAGLRSVQM